MFGAIAGVFAAPITVNLILGVAAMIRRSQSFPVPGGPWPEIAKSLVFALVPGHAVSGLIGPALPGPLRILIWALVNAGAYAALLIAVNHRGPRAGLVRVLVAAGWAACFAITLARSLAGS